MALKAKHLTANDYDYLLPDHWILPEEHLWTVMHHHYVQRVVDLVKQSAAKRVLEVGCGDGWNCGQLVKAGLQVVGIDWSHNAIAHAQRLVPQARFYCGDLRDSAFWDMMSEPFDAAIFVEVLEHIPPTDCVQSLRAITACIKRGGRLILTTPSVNHPNTNPQHYRHFDQPTLRELIDQATGLHFDSIEGYGDVVLERWCYRLARLVDNDWYTIKPLRRSLLSYYAARCLRTDLNRCHGMIVAMTRTI